MKKTAVAIVLVLGLGTGGALGLFSLLDAIALRKLPVPHPDELVAATPIDTTNSAWSFAFPPSAYGQLASMPGLFTSVAGVADGVYLGGAAGSDARWWLTVDCVTDRYFDLLGLRPKTGRLLTPADVASSAAVAVASEQFWAHRLGGSPRALGSTITLQGVTLTVVGVMPARSEVSRSASRPISPCRSACFLRWRTWTDPTTPRSAGSLAGAPPA